ncbi:MAG: hypothetical protein AAFX58_11255, partial [Pseudomonadota bacterium]
SAIKGGIAMRNATHKGLARLCLVSACLGSVPATAQIEEIVVTAAKREHGGCHGQGHGLFEHRIAPSGSVAELKRSGF